jgi:sulfatase maturation enzyme AslB (radical SAM superfamily)
MYCPRLKHFIRLQPSGKIGKCGHMIGGKEFESFEQLESSSWLEELQEKMSRDIWPDECGRCAQTEKIMQDSIRIKSIKRHQLLYPKNKQYLIVGGVLDNICNSACQTCNSTLSTKIGSLESKKYLKFNNLKQFYKLPQDRILEVDVNGGEPTASPNYKKLLANLPDNVKIVRINTNGSRFINEIVNLLKKDIMIIITLSFDGTDQVHDYVRWPIKFLNYIKTLNQYKELQKQYKLLKLNLWTTVSALNIVDFDNIITFARHHQIDHHWAFLKTPDILNVRYKNIFTLRAKTILKDKKVAEQIATDINNQNKFDLFITKQDYLRKIKIQDYFNFDLKKL